MLSPQSSTVDTWCNPEGHRELLVHPFATSRHRTGSSSSQDTMTLPATERLSEPKMYLRHP